MTESKIDRSVDPSYVPFMMAGALQFAAQDLVHLQSEADVLSRVSLMFMAAAAPIAWVRGRRSLAGVMGLLAVSSAFSGAPVVGVRSTAHMLFAGLACALLITWCVAATVHYLRRRNTTTQAPTTAV